MFQWKYSAQQQVRSTDANLQFKYLSTPGISLTRLPRYDLQLDTLIEPQKLEKTIYLCKKLNEDIIGTGTGFMGPFGWRKYTYCDHTASGKAVKCIESFIEKQVLPHYANTHTTVSYTSLQTTVFRAEAREIIKQSVGAWDNDEIFFCGSGATSAVHKLLHAVNYPKSRKIVVFVGPFEHHSNILPWREAASKVIQVPMSSLNGQVDITFLRQNLKRLTDKNKENNQLVIGCFSAGSNITGAVSDDIEITKVLHEFGALAFWDYAAAAPHVQIEMNPLYVNADGDVDANVACKDAIFFSGHKFLGGPQTPGVLVAKRRIFKNPIPHGMGGGTVLFTSKQGHQYVETLHEREEGGTPDIVGSIRLGLVFRLRNLVGVQNILKTEAIFCRRIMDAWSEIPEVHIVGHSKDPRLPCISFMIEHLKSGFFLHHNFAVALLNDLFGIQCRGGCMCAGPYALDLLGIDDKLVNLYGDYLSKKNNFGGAVLKHGFVRISINFHSSEEEIDFIIEAVKLIARHGWKLLPFYDIDWKTASFVFRGDCKQTRLSSLTSFDQTLTSTNSFEDNTKTRKLPHSTSITKYLRIANRLLTSLPIYLPTSHDIALHKFLRSDKHLRQLRWFMLSFESMLFQQQLSHIPDSIKSSSAFKPIRFDDKAYYNNKCIEQELCNQMDQIGIPGQIYRAWVPKRHRSFQEERNKSSEMMKICEFYPEQLHKMRPPIYYYEGQQGFDKFLGTNMMKYTNKSFNDPSSGFEDDKYVTT